LARTILRGHVLFEEAVAVGLEPKNDPQLRPILLKIGMADMFWPGIQGRLSKAAEALRELPDVPPVGRRPHATVAEMMHLVKQAADLIGEDERPNAPVPGTWWK
jgi:hypothetical protein